MLAKRRISMTKLSNKSSEHFRTLCKADREKTWWLFSVSFFATTTICLSICLRSWCLSAASLFSCPVCDAHQSDNLSPPGLFPLNSTRYSLGKCLLHLYCWWVRPVFPVVRARVWRWRRNATNKSSKLNYRSLVIHNVSVVARNFHWNTTNCARIYF